MSEQTTTSVSRPKSNVFTNKIGPLPMWSWMAILLVAVLLYSFYKKSSSSANNPAAQAAGQAAGGVDSSLVPQFVNQVYDNDQPPAAPNVTINNQVPPPVTVPPMGSFPKMPKEPATISGAPGSFTTGLPGGLNEWTSTGKYSLNTIAKSHGMTAQQLIAVSEKSENNPMLKAYVAKKNFNAPVPAGIQLFFPNANWAVRK
jgi:hypothetical protein